MRTHRQSVEHKLRIVIAVIIAVAVYLIIPIELSAQTKNGLLMKMSGSDSSQVSVAAANGVTERGRFEFVYSYSGEPISPDINISVNGSQVVELGSLAPVTNDTLLSRDLTQGDNINMYASFGIAEATVFLHTGLEGYSSGFWAGWGSITFYKFDPVDGSIIKVHGTMDYVYYHTPPWNGIEVGADPQELMAGEASEITLQPYETPGKPVILPDITYINLQTSLLGDLIGGLSLPEFGYRYTKGFNNAPWGSLKDTDILYEVDPSIETSDALGIPIVAYSPYDLSKSGSAIVEVGKEGDLNLILNIKGENEAWPTLTYGTAEGGNANTTPNPNERNKIKKIVVKVTKDGKPASGKNITTLAKLELPSGGHQHTNQPAKLDLGKFKDVSNNKESFGLINSVTDENGEVLLEYTTSQISGEFSISSFLTGSNGVSDSEKVLVSVEPDLINFASLGTDRWNLTGNSGTTSYKKCNGTQINHANNHYASQKLFGNLYNALIDFYEWSGMPRSKGGYGEFIKVGLNDMSLSKGGLFDICSDWGGGNEKKGHYYHRIGASVDVDTRGKAITNNELIYLMNEELPDGTTIQEKLKFFVNNHGGEKYPEATIHYGFGGN